MAQGGYDPIPEWHDDDTEYPDDDNADQTTPFFPKGASTPYQANVQEEIGMKKFKKVIVLKLLMPRLLLVGLMMIF